MYQEVSFKNGDTYNGHVDPTTNKFNGYGEYYSSKNNYYLSGNWQNSKPTTSMTLNLLSKNIKILADFDPCTAKIITNKVKVIFTSQDTYEGSINSSYELDGQGTYTFYNDKHYKSISGSFKNNHIEGKCTILTKDSIKIEAFFRNKLPIEKFSIKDLKNDSFEAYAI